MHRSLIAGALALAFAASPALAAPDCSTYGCVISLVDQPFSGAVPMVVGTAQPGQRSIGANCTAAGSMTITLLDGSTIALPLGVGWQTFPFAATLVSASTATCAFSNLK